MLPSRVGSTVALAVCFVVSAGADAVLAGQAHPPAQDRPAGVGAIRFDNDTHTSILDRASTEIPFPVAGITGVHRVTVSLHATHTFVGDLTISLVSPDGTAAVLVDRSISGADLGTGCANRTTFADIGGGSIVTGTSPFAGTFQPEQPLSTFKGKTGAAANGTWKLRIQDSASFLGTGTFFCGSIEIVSCDGGCERQPTDAQRISDFDGDGRSDATIFRPSTGTWFSLHSNSGFTTFQSKVWGGGGDTPASGDFDGDGKTDFAVYRGSTGRWFVLYSSSNYTTLYQVDWLTTGGIPVPGNYDLDGDSRLDLAVFNPTNGQWWIRILTVLGVWGWGGGISLGVAGDKPVQADYDGDGRTDVAVFRPGTGQWLIKTSSSIYATTLTYPWGIGSDIPVPGDYDGDGKADVAVYRPSTGEWWALHSSTNFATYTRKIWGGGGDTPVPGDFDGDTRTDLAVFRPSTGTWFILLSAANYTTYTSFNWGGGGDIPVLGRQ